VGVCEDLKYIFHQCFYLIVLTRLDRLHLLYMVVAIAGLTHPFFTARYPDIFYLLTAVFACAVSTLAVVIYVLSGREMRAIFQRGVVFKEGSLKPSGRDHPAGTSAIIGLFMYPIMVSFSFSAVSEMNNVPFIVMYCIMYCVFILVYIMPFVATHPFMVTKHGLYPQVSLWDKLRGKENFINFDDVERVTPVLEWNVNVDRPRVSEIWIRTREHLYKIKFLDENMNKALEALRSAMGWRWSRVYDDTGTIDIKKMNEVLPYLPYDKRRVRNEAAASSVIMVVVCYILYLVLPYLTTWDFVVAILCMVVVIYGIYLTLLLILAYQIRPQALGYLKLIERYNEQHTTIPIPEKYRKYLAEINSGCEGNRDLENADWHTVFRRYRQGLRILRAFILVSGAVSASLMGMTLISFDTYYRTAITLAYVFMCTLYPIFIFNMHYTQKIRRAVEFEIRTGKSVIPDDVDDEIVRFLRYGTSTNTESMKEELNRLENKMALWWLPLLFCGILMVALVPFENITAIMIVFEATGISFLIAIISICYYLPSINENIIKKKILEMKEAERYRPERT